MTEVEIAGKTYPVYSQKEADEAGIDYVYWMQVDSEDQWALTDDGYVMAVRKIYRFPESRSSKMIAFAGAQKWVNDSSELIWEDYKRTGNYHSANPETDWVDREAGKTRTKRAIKMMAVSFIHTGEFDWKRAGEAYRPDQQIPEATLRRLFHKEKIKNMLKEELRKQYQEMGFTEEWVVENIMEAAQTAKDNQDPLNQLRAAEKGIELLGMKPGQVRETTERTADFSQSVIENAKEYRAKLSEKTITQQPENSPSVQQDPTDDEQQDQPEDTQLQGD